MVEYFTKAEAADEFKFLFKDQPELIQEVDFESPHRRVNLNNPGDYELIIERMDGNLTVRRLELQVKRLIDS